MGHLRTDEPRTEAGRRLLADYDDPEGPIYPPSIEAVVFIEEEAYAEGRDHGRQQAVREIRHDFVEEWANPNPGQSMSRERRKAMLDWAETRKRRTLAILDRVAGLNVSESWVAEQVGEPTMYEGDASESGQPPDTTNPASHND